ncbi:hypothetical protein HZS_3536 [Henneguya salminicola]|nr:hypothetical protein HZS_3536 [Henneguya salminicola]
MTSSDLSLVIISLILVVFIAYHLWNYSVLEISVLKYIPFVYVVFFLSFYGVMILPFDISSTYYSICINSSSSHATDCIKPENYIDPDILIKIWRSIYWSLFIMAWYFIKFEKKLFHPSCSRGYFKHRRYFSPHTCDGVWIYRRSQIFMEL